MKVTTTKRYGSYGTPLTGAEVVEFQKLQAAEKSIDLINDAIKAIRADNTLDAKQKADQIQGIEKSRLDAFRAALSTKDLPRPPMDYKAPPRKWGQKPELPPLPPR